jgi:hypothetical protein
LQFDPCQVRKNFHFLFLQKRLIIESLIAPPHHYLIGFLQQKILRK